MIFWFLDIVPYNHFRPILASAKIISLRKKVDSTAALLKHKCVCKEKGEGREIERASCHQKGSIERALWSDVQWSRKSFICNGVHISNVTLWKTFNFLNKDTQITKLYLCVTQRGKSQFLWLSVAWLWISDEREGEYDPKCSDRLCWGLPLCVKNRSLGDDKKQSITIQRMNATDSQTSNLCDDLINVHKRQKYINSRYNEENLILF